MRCFVFLMTVLSFSVLAQEETWYLGEWRLTEVKYPGITAMTDQDAAVWLDNKIVYSHSAVTLLGETCHHPEYEIEYFSAGEYIGRGSGDAFINTLDINDPSLEMVNVSCEPQWIGPGFHIIKEDERSGYILWDGAYFLIAKER